MADYIFNVYLHTDRGEFNKDYSLSEYSFNLPSFYFALNEYVSAKAEINILNSNFLCSGASIYYGRAILAGESMIICDATKATYYSVDVIFTWADSKALVIAKSIGYYDILDTIYVHSTAKALLTYIG
jgi:hypothetical protein